METMASAKAVNLLSTLSNSGMLVFLFISFITLFWLLSLFNFTAPFGVLDSHFGGTF